MPGHIGVVWHRQVVPPKRRPSSRDVSAPLLARLRGSWLDRQLAAGTPSWASPAHAARARQLTGRRRRRRLADALDGLVAHAEQPPALPYARTPVVEPCGEQVRHAMLILVHVSYRLRSDLPLNAKGVARLWILLSDGAGPCYAQSRPDALSVALEAIDEALDTPE